MARVGTRQTDPFKLPARRVVENAAYEPGKGCPNSSRGGDRVIKSIEALVRMHNAQEEDIDDHAAVGQAGLACFPLSFTGRQAQLIGATDFCLANDPYSSFAGNLEKRPHAGHSEIRWERTYRDWPLYLQLYSCSTSSRSSPPPHGSSCLRSVLVYRTRYPMGSPLSPRPRRQAAASYSRKCRVEYCGESCLEMTQGGTSMKFAMESNNIASHLQEV